MLRKLAAAAAVAAVFALGVPAAAFAADAPNPSPSPTQTVDPSTDYTPQTPIEPSLTGSFVMGQCVNDVPYITYKVHLNDPDNISKSHTAYLHITKGSDAYVVELGTFDANNNLSGQILWPGASVNKDGSGRTWPGWDFVNGQLQNVGDANYGWTRSGITAQITVNPEVYVPLSYPPATAACNGPHPKTASLDGSLPVTGLNVPVVPIAIAGGIVILAGVGVLIARRMRRS
jgi:hypothetical protein